MKTGNSDEASEANVAELAANFKWDGGGKLQDGLALAMSGGGFRAMLFHAGALLRLNELGLLTRLKRISSVSGGSIAAGYLAKIWPTEGILEQGAALPDFKSTYVSQMLAFSRRSIDWKCALVGLLPFVSAAELVAKCYRRHLLGNARLQDTPDQPRFVFCATNLQSGVLFRFSKPYAGDYVVGRWSEPDILLSDVVSASSAFPPFLSPRKFRMRDGDFGDWQTSFEGQRLTTNELTALRRTLILTDGGVYDNHGLEPIVKRYRTLLVSDGGAPFGRAPRIGFDWVRQLLRVVNVTDNQVRAQRRQNLIDRFKAGKAALDKGTSGSTDPYPRLGVYWGIDTLPGSTAPPNALSCDTVLVRGLARTSTRLADHGDIISKQLINWGYAITDRCVRTYLAGVGSFPHASPKWPYPEAKLS